MAFKNKYFDPKTFYYKVIVICILIAVDIIFNSFTQFLDFGSSNAVSKYEMTGIKKGTGDTAYGLFA